MDEQIMSFESKVYAIRYERGRRLTASDWTQLPDAPLTTDAVEAWRVYRQQLRDLPEAVTEDNIDGVVWPIPPE